MPTPLRDDGSAGPQKHLLIFVHGFSSSGKCWDRLICLIEKDPRFAAYEVRKYEYKTQKFHAGVTTRIPTLKELARGLGAYLGALPGESLDEQYIDITLIGHSMGGLIIQAWIVDCLEQNRGIELRQIRQILLIGTPNLGSTVVSPLRKFLYSFIPNPQERSLRLFDEEIHDIGSSIQRKVLGAGDRTENQCPIPFHAFWGQTDAIVVEASARGAFPNCTPLPADHFGIIRPPNAQSDIYVLLTDAILEPVGHPMVFEVEQFRFFVRVEPRSADFTYTAEYGGKRRLIRTNNVAYLRREAKFSRKNRCWEPFEIKYSTRTEGFVKYSVSHPNLDLAPAHSLDLWEDYGTSAFFVFRPEAQQVYALNLEVFKGFDEDCTDVHQHLHPRAYFPEIYFRARFVFLHRIGTRPSSLTNVMFLAP